jgi:hypothetical protein
MTVGLITYTKLTFMYDLDVYSYIPDWNRFRGGRANEKEVC